MLGTADLVRFEDFPLQSWGSSRTTGRQGDVRGSLFLISTGGFWRAGVAKRENWIDTQAWGQAGLMFASFPEICPASRERESECSLIPVRLRIGLRSNGMPQFLSNSRNVLVAGLIVYARTQPSPSLVQSVA